MTSTRYHKVPPRQQSRSPSTCPDKHASPFDFTLDKCPKNPFTRPTGGDPNLHRITLKQLKCGFLRSPSNRWHMRARCRALANCAKPAPLSHRATRAVCSQARRWLSSYVGFPWITG